MPRDDDFSVPTKQRLAKRVGYICSYPNCLAPTSGPAIDGDKSVNIGVAAHITAASPKGPRFDPSMPPEQRHAAENGIWMCATHATLIDRDVDKYPIELLRDWKFAAEDRAMKMLGQPRGCASGKIASVSPATKLGADSSVLVDGQPVPYISIFDADDNDTRMTWFVNAFVIQFSIQKHQNRVNAVLDHLIVTVHETKDIPPYRPLFGAYPTEVTLFYVEIDKNIGKSSREFRPTRYYQQGSDAANETQHYPAPIVIDDSVPAHVAIRFNAKSSAMYLMSLDAMISAGDDRELLPVMPPQWAIFERSEPDD
jgi:hypothetical protein